MKLMLIIYTVSLQKKTKNKHNKNILNSIASDEDRHYKILKEYTKKEVKPSNFKVYIYIFLARLFGFTFALKLLEKAEQKAQDTYIKIGESFPKFKKNN